VVQLMELVAAFLTTPLILHGLAADPKHYLVQQQLTTGKQNFLSLTPIYLILHLYSE
jgi:hypothetical protein